MNTADLANAFQHIARADFVPARWRGQAAIDAPLPIGWGQTISQPSTVAFMLELLQPQSGDRALDIGSGSGWVTVLLAYLVGETGHVVALEIIPELCERGRANVAKYNFLAKGIVEIYCQDAVHGFPDRAPYDKIIAAASLSQGYGWQASVPKSWTDQLKVGGRMVVPIESSIWLLVKKSANEFAETEYPGFAFVPFVTS